MNFQFDFCSIQMCQVVKKVVDPSLMVLVQVFDHHDVGVARKRT
jgi:hypothetical protein